MMEKLVDLWKEFSKLFNPENSEDLKFIHALVIRVDHAHWLSCNNNIYLIRVIKNLSINLSQ